MTFVEQPSERRRHARTQITLPVQALRLDPDGDVLENIEMTDISRGGIGATSVRPFYPGQRVLLRLPAPGLAVRNICATVRRCERMQEDYRLGFEFEQPLVSLAAENNSATVATLAA